jgi:hypothetical protein
MTNETKSKGKKGDRPRRTIDNTPLPDYLRIGPMFPMPDFKDKFLHQLPEMALIIYLRKSGALGTRTVDLVRGQYSMFTNVDDLWARQVVNQSALFEAEFSYFDYERNNPDIVSKVFRAKEWIRQQKEKKNAVE